MFYAEFESLRFQIETLEKSENPLRLQNETSKGRGGTRYLPYAFTEQGVAMLSGILNSDKAISMNIAIMRAFVEIRHIALKQIDLKEQLKEIKERLGEHDVQLNQIYDAMENMLDEKPDLASFFEFYKVINAKALSERIGMNQSLLAQYINGSKKPSPTQTQRILKGVQQVGKELASIQFFL